MASSKPTSSPSLSDSFVMIPSEREIATLPIDDEDETETGSTSSTINTALLDLDALSSDSESEPRHPGSLEGSFHGDLSEASDDLDFDQDHHDHNRRSSFGDSYIDAEATASASLLTESRSTIGHQTDLSASPNMPEFAPVRRLTQSGQIQFIFPHPEASFSSSGTYTDGVTPSGSLANLPPVVYPVPPAREGGSAPVISGIGNDAPFARLSVEARQKSEKGPIRGVDEGWLKDARTWAPSHTEPVTMMMPSWEKGQYDSLESGEVAGPTEEGKVVVSKEAGAVDAEAQDEKREDQKRFFPVEESQLHLKRALRAMVDAGAGSSGNRWGLLAVASCALAILGALGPGMTYLSRNETTAPSYNVSANGTSRSVPPHGTIPLDEIFTSTEAPSTASQAQTARSLATQLIPDLQSIRNTISTFASGPKDEARTPPSDQLQGTHRCSGSSGEPVEAHAISPYSKGGLSIFDDTGFKAWMRAMSNAVLQASPAAPPVPAATSPTMCRCATPSSIQLDNRYAYLVQRARDYALSTSSAIAQLYHPMMLHLDHELRELSRLALYVAERNITRSSIRRMHAAGLGARDIGLKLAEGCARQRALQLGRLHQVKSSASAAWTKMTEGIRERSAAEKEALRQVVRTAQVGRARLEEKVDAMKFRLEGRVDDMKAEGWRTLVQAKKGLDLLKANLGVSADGELQAEAQRGDVRDVAAWAAEAVKVVDDGDMRRSTRHRFTRTGRMLRERRSRGIRRREEGSKWAAMQGEASEADPRAVAGKKTSVTGCGTGCKGQTKWRRLLEAVHHGAIQVVLH